VDSACTGDPKTLNGVPCASTTRYWDNQMGACGCGTDSSHPFSFQWQNYTAAASPPIFGSATWCGSGCGKCFQLTPTGYSPTGGNGCGSHCSPITVMVTNLCPQQGNEQWCAPHNKYGYGGHFDLMDQNMNGIISKIGWNNPEVTYKEVPCGGGGAPSDNSWKTCQCAKR